MEDEVQEVAAPEVVEAPEVSEDVKPEVKAEPEASEKVEEKAPSRREALAKAMAATDDEKPDEKPEKPAEEKAAKPEPEKAAKAEDAAKPEKADTESPEDDQPRNADGTFKAKEDGAEEKAEDSQDAKAQSEEPKDAAPGRFSADAKAEWEKTAPSVKGETLRAIREMESGLAQKDAVLAPLKPYMDMAAQHGVDFGQTIGRYVQMDRLLGTDLKQGLATIAQNYGMTLPDMIAKVTGEESPSTDGDRDLVSLRQQLQQQNQVIAQLQTQMTGQREEAVIGKIDQFAASHPRFDELSGEITRMIETGYAQDLEDAYAKAERLNPVPTPQPPMAAPTPPQPRRSVTGAPTAGSDPAARKPSATRREALQRAAAQAGL